MIIGEPNVFAFFFEVIAEWNDDNSFNNGLMFVNINEKIIPNKLLEATLNTELSELIQNLEKIKVNKNIFIMNKEDAFRQIYKLTFPNDYNTDNDYSYNVTPFVLWDNHYFIFMVSNGDEIRVLVSELKYLKEESLHELEELEVAETYISVKKMEEIINKMKMFQLQIQTK